MAPQIPLTWFTRALDELLAETFMQVQGIYLDKGTALFETLDTVSAAEASRPVSATCASIAAQVEHVSFYLEVLARYLRGEAVGEVDWAVSWRRTDVTPAEWDARKERLGEAHRDIMALVRDGETWKDEGAIGSAGGSGAYRLSSGGDSPGAVCGEAIGGGDRPGLTTP